MRLPMSKESTFIIGIALVGFPIYSLVSAKLEASKHAKAQATSHQQSRAPKLRAYDKD